MDYCETCGDAAGGRCPLCRRIYCTYHGGLDGYVWDEHGFTYRVYRHEQSGCKECRDAEARRMADRAATLNLVELALFHGRRPQEWEPASFWPAVKSWLVFHQPPEDHEVAFTPADQEFRGHAVPTERRPIRGWRFEERDSGTVSPRTTILCLEDMQFRDWQGMSFRVWATSGREILGYDEFWSPMKTPAKDRIYHMIHGK